MRKKRNSFIILDMYSQKEIIVLLDGFTEEEVEKALATYSAAQEGEGNIRAIFLAPADLKKTTEQLINTVAAGQYQGGEANQGAAPTVLIAQCGKKEAVSLTRFFKKVLPPQSDPVFALVTEKGLAWTIEYYLSHIRQEHEFMKNADPSQDPDMKEIE